MTIKYTKLEEFCRHLFKKGYTSQISESLLGIEIAKFFNVCSLYNLRQIKFSLGRFEFIAPLGNGTYEIKKIAAIEREAGVPEPAAPAAPMKKEEVAIDELLHFGE